MANIQRQLDLPESMGYESAKQAKTLDFYLIA